MTSYLLDRDVLSQLDQPDAKRHLNVRAWLRTVPDNVLHVSAITVMEAWRGLAKARKAAASSPDDLRRCRAFEDAFERLMATFEGRIVAVDGQVGMLWGQLRGRLDRNHWDLGVAATAIVNDMIVTTRNVSDFQGRGVRVMDPFSRRPRITGSAAT